MDLTGKLCLNEKTNDYMIFAGGRTSNLSEYLNMLIFERVSVVVTSSYSGQVCVDRTGQLLKVKVGKYLYQYSVGGNDIDSVLWNLVGNRVNVKVKRI